MDVERRVARYKYLMKKNHDAMVKPRQFNIGDLILKRASLSTMYPTYRKVGPNWKGPYKVINFKRRGTYYLVALDGQMLEHLWNMEHLRKYYQQQVIRRGESHICLVLSMCSTVMFISSILFPKYLSSLKSTSYRYVLQTCLCISIP